MKKTVEEYEKKDQKLEEGTSEYYKLKKTK